MILCIETATGVCSAALCSDSGTLHLREAAEGKSHASQLTVFIRELLAEASVSASDLDAVAVSKGPGSYTGLRIGVSVAKGIAFGAGIPLIGINTMTAMYYGYASKYKIPRGETLLLCPMIDARRMEVYNALFTPEGIMIRETAANIIDVNSFHDELEKGRVVFFGNGAAKCNGIIKDSNAVFVSDFDLSASYLQLPSTEALKEKRFEDTAYFEPFYLKEFLATIPKKMIP
ncbi:MAG TPA: tRNA (adenosine(37)-N6)-threonylcarbamoyltransferase complex dimerization subunit type 1 TsaB [Bacteroidales bacterium]|nr:tRNA (adenosine(37)-N6)-threonylcarbamoyltransferase complex dimerization subunit type 1 TsaB [Bacteroidales bacterium]